MSWDWLLSVAIIVGLILAFWARITKQTIGELLSDITDWIRGFGEETSERGEQIVFYE